MKQRIKISHLVAWDGGKIFDCKVLSRNYALLWYDSFKFYIKDTKFYNRFHFIKNKRLGSSSEESIAHEVCSGDIKKFRVDVIESTKKLTQDVYLLHLNFIYYSLEDLYKLN